MAVEVLAREGEETVARLDRPGVRADAGNIGCLLFCPGGPAFDGRPEDPG
jgi:hypothetical protein